MIGQKDPLIGALPPKKDARSPALTGQDSTVTGAGGAGGIGQMPTSESALAPAPSPGGNAQVGGAPLSSNEAQIRQGGAGADLDLLKDRGTASEYWAGNLKTLGSAKALDLMASAANAASGRTGQQASMDPEEVRRAGVQANEAFGVGNTREQQDNAVEGLVYAPMTAQVREEVGSGVLDEDEGVLRIAQTMAQVQGPKSEDELAEIVVEARKRVTGTPVEVTGEMDELVAGSEQVKYETERAQKEASKDHDGDGKKDSIWSRAKTWWKKGKDDPTTSVDESKETFIGPDGKPQTRDVQVTKFMGGMTRQELGMFVFQWGSQMMANADKGFGGAMGAAGEGALAGHLERTAANQATEASAAQQKIENQLNQQKADASTTQADAAMISAEAQRERAKYAGMGYQGKDAYLADRFRKEGMSDAEINAILRGVEGTEVRAQKLQDSLNKMIEGAGIIDTVVIDGKSVKLKGMSAEDQKKWIKERLQNAAEAAKEYDEMMKGSTGALPDDTAAAALPDDEPVKSASDYLNSAQTG
jgi:hypothetical protein